MALFPPLPLVASSCCLLIRRVALPWTYRTVFFTGYGTLGRLDSPDSRQRGARPPLDDADIGAVDQPVDGYVFAKVG
jgi:hypothetical protein